MYIVYDRMYGDFPANNTVHTPYVRVCGFGQPCSFSTWRVGTPQSCARPSCHDGTLAALCSLGSQIHSHAHMQAHKHTHTHTHITNSHAHMQAHKHTHTHTHTTNLLTRTHASTHKHTHTHTHITNSLTRTHASTQTHAYTHAHHKLTHTHTTNLLTRTPQMYSHAHMQTQTHTHAHKHARTHIRSVLGTASSVIAMLAARASKPGNPHTARAA